MARVSTERRPKRVPDARREEVGMPLDVWAFRTPVEEVDLSDFKVEAVDGSIGKIDEWSREVGAGYIVVDTGPWIFGKRVMIPAGAISTIDLDERKVYLDRTKDEIKSAPEFDPDRAADSAYRTELGQYYGRYYP
jgi:hypothetical protein